MLKEQVNSQINTTEFCKYFFPFSKITFKLGIYSNTVFFHLKSKVNQQQDIQYWTIHKNKYVFLNVYSDFIKTVHVVKIVILINFIIVYTFSHRIKYMENIYWEENILYRCKIFRYSKDTITFMINIKFLRENG